MPSRLFTNKVFKSLLTGFQTNCIPVSYTHLDVYKRQTYYFAKDGKQVKGQTVTAGNGRISYYYGDSGKRAVSTWVEIQPGVYVYFDKNGLAYPPRVLN